MGRNLADDLVFNERGLFAEEGDGEEGSYMDGIDRLLAQAGCFTGTQRVEDENVEDAAVRTTQGVGKVVPSSSIIKRSTSRHDDGGTGPSKPKKLARAKRRVTKPRDYLTYYLDTKYDVLSEVVQDLPGDWQEVNTPDDDVNLLWFDSGISVEKFIKLRTYQKVNHFVGMTSITRKNNLGRNLLRMKKRFPEEYRFFPDTWILPTDLPDFKAQFNGRKNKTFIVKPSDGYQGKGIFLTREFENVPVDYNSTIVVQRYIHKPLLLDGHKFDLRLYVLVTGCDPLRIFLHEQGLVRLASEKYAEPRGKNLQQTMVHLTNYAINCENPEFQENTNPEDGTDGHKRSFQAVLQELGENGVDVALLRAEIEDLVVKTLISVQPSLSHVYRSCQPDDIENAMCFEILGFDILLDSKAKPWLIEVNQAPSFRTETRLDHLVKRQVLLDAFEIVNVNPEDRKKYCRQQAAAVEDRMYSKGLEKRSVEDRLSLEEEVAAVRTKQEHAVKNGYRALHPAPDGKEDEHEPFMSAAVDIWEIMTGSSSSRKKRQPAKDEAGAPGCDDGRRGVRSRSIAGKAAGCAAPSKKSSTSVAAENPSSAGIVEEGEADARPKLLESEEQPDGAPNEECHSSRRGSSQSSIANVAGQEGATASDAQPPQSSSAPLVTSSTAGRQAGDAIHVQTNFGWEPVTILRVHDTGQVDIKFQDGEVMLRALPRILDLQQTDSANMTTAQQPPIHQHTCTEKFFSNTDLKHRGSPCNGGRPNTGFRGTNPFHVVAAVRSSPARVSSFAGQAHAVIPTRRPLHPPPRPQWTSPDGHASMAMTQMGRASSMPAAAASASPLPHGCHADGIAADSGFLFEASLTKRGDCSPLGGRKPTSVDFASSSSGQTSMGADATSSFSLPMSERRPAAAPACSHADAADILKTCQHCQAEVKRRSRVRPPAAPLLGINSTKDRAPGPHGGNVARQPHFTLEAHSVQPPPSWQRRRDGAGVESIPPLPPPGTQRQRPLLKAV